MSIYIENISTNKMTKISLLEYTKFVIEKAKEGYTVFETDVCFPEDAVFVLGQKSGFKTEYFVHM